MLTKWFSDFCGHISETYIEETLVSTSLRWAGILVFKREG